MRKRSELPTVAYTIDNTGEIHLLVKGVGVPTAIIAGAPALKGEHFFPMLTVDFPIYKGEQFVPWSELEAMGKEEGK